MEDKGIKMDPLAHGNPRAEEIASYTYNSKVDSSMFSEQELGDIGETIDKFLQQLKKQESETDQKQLNISPLKRAVTMPLVLVALSCIALFFISTLFLNDLSIQGDNLFARFFGVRVSNNNEGAEVSGLTKELILEVRDENEARLVEIFVDIINEDNESQASGDQAGNASNDEAVNPVDEALIAEIALLQERISQSEVLVASSNTEFTSLQRNLQALSVEYDQANLQKDQYAAIVNSIHEALTNNNLTTLGRRVGRLENFISLTSTQDNLLLRDITRTGPAFVESARLYLRAAEDLQRAQRQLSAQSDELAQDDNEQVADNAQVGELERRNAQLSSQNERLSSQNAELSSQSRELHQQLEQLLVEIRAIREASN